MGGTDPSDGQPITAEVPAVDLAGLPALAATPAAGIAGPTAPAARQASASSSHGPRPVAVTVWRRVDRSVDDTFDIVVPIELASVFTGHGPLPAVVGTEPDDAPWGERAGQQRTVLLAGGGRMRETILEAARPGLFRYEVIPTEGPMRLIVRRIDGRFIFSRSEAGGTVIRWTYVFRPRRGAHSAVRALAPIWHRYADEVMGRLAAAVAASAPRSETAAPGD